MIHTIDWRYFLRLLSQWSRKGKKGGGKSAPNNSTRGAHRTPTCMINYQLGLNTTWLTLQFYPFSYSTILALLTTWSHEELSITYKMILYFHHHRMTSVSPRWSHLTTLMVLELFWLRDHTFSRDIVASELIWTPSKQSCVIALYFCCLISSQHDR